MYVQKRVTNKSRSGLGEWDFSSIVSDIAKAYTGVTQAQAAADIAKAQAQQQAAANQAALALRYNPTYSGTYSGASQSSDMMPIILLAGAGLLVFMLMKD